MGNIFIILGSKQSRGVLNFSRSLSVYLTEICKQSRGVLNFSRSLRRLQVVILAYRHSSAEWTTEVHNWGELCSFKCQMWCLGVKSREYTLWCTHTLYSCFLPQICEKLREQNEKTISTITATRDVIQAMHKNEYSLITSTQFRNKFT